MCQKSYFAHKRPNSGPKSDRNPNLTLEVVYRRGCEEVYEMDSEGMEEQGSFVDEMGFGEMCIDEFLAMLVDEYLEEEKHLETRIIQRHNQASLEPPNSQPQKYSEEF